MTKTDKNNDLRVRFQFHNRQTGVVAETYIPCKTGKIDSARAKANREALLSCEHAVTGDILEKDLTLLPYELYSIWTVPGNAVKSYDKLIVSSGEIDVRVKLIA